METIQELENQSSSNQISRSSGSPPPSKNIFNNEYNEQYKQYIPQQQSPTQLIAQTNDQQKAQFYANSKKFSTIKVTDAINHQDQSEQRKSPVKKQSQSPFLKKMDSMKNQQKNNLQNNFQYKALLMRDVGMDISQILQQASESFKSKESQMNQGKVKNDEFKVFRSSNSSSPSVRARTENKRKTTQIYQIYNTASVIKVKRNQKVVQSPDDVKSINLKKTELNWIFNNVKNNIIPNISYYTKVPFYEQKNDLKRAVMIISKEQLLNESTYQKDIIPKDPATTGSPNLCKGKCKSEVEVDQSQQFTKVQYMQAVTKVPKRLHKKQATQKYSAKNLVQNSINSLISNNTTNVNFNINININQQDSSVTFHKNQTQRQKSSKRHDNLNEDFDLISDASLIKQGTQNLTKDKLKDLIQYQHVLEDSMSSSSFSVIDMKPFKEQKLVNMKPKINKRKSKFDTSQKKKKLAARINELKNNFLSDKDDDEDEEEEELKTNKVFIDPLQDLESSINDLQITPLRSKKVSKENKQSENKKAMSKWKKIKLLIGSMTRLRRQEAKKIENPDQIIDEIKRIKKIKKHPRSSKSQINVNTTQLKKNDKVTPDRTDQKHHIDINKKAEKLVNGDRKKEHEKQGKRVISEEVKDSGVQHYLEKVDPTKQLNKQKAIENFKNEQSFVPIPKVREIDYFRKVKKFFQCAERGSKQDEARMLRELKNDIKKHMWRRDDSHHLLNQKNAFGQTPLYVACENGNLNIVKLLLQEGCNPFIKSSIDENNEENNLQVSARWMHYDIVKFLIENLDWPRKDIKDAILTEGIPPRIKNLLIDHYRRKYGKVCFIKCCFNFWN